MIPLIYCNAGKRPWTEYSVRCAQKFCPSADIHIISDCGEQYPNVRSHDMRDYSRNAAILIKNYRHMSNNPDWFELGCLKRWPIVLDFVVAQGMKTFIVADWDILFCTDYNRLLMYDKYDFTYQNSASIGLSLWNNVSALQWLVDLINECYTNVDSSIYTKFKKIWDWHQETKCPGGISDMSFAVELIQCSGYTCFDTYTVQTDSTGSRFCWDNNMSHADDGRWEDTGYGVKAVRWERELPFCHNVLLGDVDLLCMHFAGNARQTIKQHYENLMLK